MEREAKIELKPKAIHLDMTKTGYQRILGGPPGSVSMRSGLVQLLPGSSVGVHNTGDYEELIIVLEGQGEFRSNGQDALAIGKGVMAYCPPETEHNVVNTGSAPLQYVYVVAKARS